MMHTTRKTIAVAAIFFTLYLSLPAMAGAGNNIFGIKGNREGTWDFYLPLSYAEEAAISGRQGSRVDLDDDIGFGFGVGYNFNEHFQLSGRFNWISRSYEATAVREDGSRQRYCNNLETSTISIDGTYYILDSSITPFISGMIGYTFADTNIQNGPATGWCWYDPWWGYVCSEYVPTRTEEAMSYGAGLGIRFDINRHFGMQGSYNRTWIDFDKTSGTPDFDTWRLDFILRMF